METTADIVIETPQSTGVRGNLDYRLIVMRQIDRCGITLAKLPHEVQLSNINTVSGCTYDDITRSFSDGVRFLEAMLAPYIDEEYGRQRKELNKEFSKDKDRNYHSYFIKKYGQIISLCARLGMLLEPLGEEGV